MYDAAALCRYFSWVSLFLDCSSGTHVPADGFDADSVFYDDPNVNLVNIAYLDT